MENQDNMVDSKFIEAEKKLSIQVQSTKIDADILLIYREFVNFVSTVDIVKDHSFVRGNDDWPFYNFIFVTTDVESLWSMVKNQFYADTKIGQLMRKSSIVVCPSDKMWDDYLLLYHFDPKVKLDLFVRHD